MMDSFSKQWSQIQLTHHVSITASNSFWNLGFKYIGALQNIKEQERNNRKIPQFVHVRRCLYKDYCPDVKMSFAFLNTSDGSIVHVSDDHNPVNKYERDPKYKKLYEEAHIEVNLYELKYAINIFLTRKI